MNDKPPSFKNRDLRGESFQGKNLAAAYFHNCNLAGCDFSRTNLAGARFERCTATDAPLILSHTNCERITIAGCRFPFLIARNVKMGSANLRETDFTNADFLGAIFDSAVLDGCNVSRANLHFTSFRRAKLVSVSFRPAYRTGLAEVAKAVWTQPSTRVIFTSGTEDSPFVRHCVREHRLGQIIAEIRQLDLLRRIFFAGVVLIFGIISDYGNSLSRLLLFTVAVVVVGVVGISVTGVMDLSAAVLITLSMLLGLSDTETLPIFAVIYAMVGYLILAVLIAILTTRFVSRM